MEFKLLMIQLNMNPGDQNKKRVKKQIKEELGEHTIIIPTWVLWWIKMISEILKKPQQWEDYIKCPQ